MSAAPLTATGLISLLLNVASSQDMPFCWHHSATFVLQLFSLRTGIDL